MTPQLPHFRHFFAAVSYEKVTKNGAAVTSLRSFLFCEDFSRKKGIKKGVDETHHSWISHIPRPMND